MGHAGDERPRLLDEGTDVVGSSELSCASSSTQSSKTHTASGSSEVLTTYWMQPVLLSKSSAARSKYWTRSSRLPG